MLAEKNRLRKKKDFERVYKKGIPFSCAFFILKKVKNNTDISRFGFVVSLKVSKKAVIRNKIKRRLRGIIRQKMGVIATGYDVVILTRKGIAEKDFTETKQMVEKLLTQAKLTPTRSV